MPIPAPEVERVVREWLVAKQGADADGIRAALSTYDGVLAIGTDADEWWSGSKAFVAAHTSGAAFAADLQSVEAHRDGPIAWAAIRAVIQTGDPGGWRRTTPASGASSSRTHRRPQPTEHRSPPAPGGSRRARCHARHLALRADTTRPPGGRLSVDAIMAR
jgi:hypothetical protein